MTKEELIKIIEKFPDKAVFLVRFGKSRTFGDTVIGKTTIHSCYTKIDEVKND